MADTLSPALAPAGRRAPHRARAWPSASAWHDFMALARPYWQGDRRRSAWALLALLVLLMLCETQLAVMLNEKAGEMTSALAGRDDDRFWAAVRGSLLVVAFAAPCYAFYYFMRDTFANHWRRWLTGRFLDGYLHERRYYALAGAQDIDNPDQRIAEDINTFTGRSIHFLLILIGSLMQLVAFSAVLWSISHLLVGFLVLYALVGTGGALLLFGPPLIRLNFQQLRREADFRFGLIRLRENAESIAFHAGEAQERAQLDLRFLAVFRNYARLVRRQCGLNLFQRAFGQLTLVLPAVILAGDVLAGRMEVGRAVQAAGAFAVVLTAVSLIVDNFESLCRFVAGIDRLQALSQRVLAPQAAPDAAAAPAPRIRHEDAPGLGARALTLYTPGAEQLLIDRLDFQLAPGDALLVTGASGCGKSSLLRALAGLWHNGSGTICHPPREQMFFLPQQPYVQAGTLRGQLLYPATTSALTDAELLAVLEAVRLPLLAERCGGLDASHDWGKLLSVGEQQRLALARVLVHRPRTVILDEATSALDADNEAALYATLCASGASLVSIAHREAVRSCHTHHLELLGGGRWRLQRIADGADPISHPQPGAPA